MPRFSPLDPHTASNMLDTIASSTNKDVAMDSKSLQLKGTGDCYDLTCDNVNAKEEKMNSLRSSNQCSANLPRLINCTGDNIKHQYKDRNHDSLIPVVIPEMRMEAERKGPEQVIESFPLKLHTLLSQVEKEGIMDIISWKNHGRCFVIHKPERFAREVMPRHFNQSKFASFRRQLNLYGFRRLMKGVDRGGYYHELFLCERPDLCSRIIRMKRKGNNRKLLTSNTEPLFHSMKPCSDTIFPTQKTSTKYLSSIGEVSHTEIKKESTIFHLGKSNIPSEEQIKNSRALGFLDGCLGIKNSQKSGNNEGLKTVSLRSMAGTIATPERTANSSAYLYPPRQNSPFLALNEAYLSYLRRNSINNETRNYSCQPSIPQSPSCLPSSSLKLPNPGEKIFFEGCAFRYLDTFGFEDLKELSTALI